MEMRHRNIPSAVANCCARACVCVCKRDCLKRARTRTRHTGIVYNMNGFRWRNDGKGTQIAVDYRVEQHFEGGDAVRKVAERTL